MSAGSQQEYDVDNEHEVVIDDLKEHTLPNSNPNTLSTPNALPQPQP